MQTEGITPLSIAASLTEETQAVIKIGDDTEEVAAEEKAAPTHRITKKPELPKPNRAQRRRLQRARAKLQPRFAFQSRRCPRCHLSYLGGSAQRCQCRVRPKT